MHRFKLITLYIAKCLGLFYLASMVTSRGLRILCYHGFSVGDEHVFRPKLFITEEVFKRRLKKIAQMQFSVISLDQAVNSLKNGEMLHRALVLTIDDGWQGVETIAAPLLAAHHFPWTLYLTTYYVQKQTQVTNVAIQYLCWKTNRSQVNLSRLDTSINENVLLKNQEDKVRLANRLIELQDKLITSEERQLFVRRLASLLGVNQEAIEKTRMLHLLKMESVRKLHQSGVDIQLHTHRHSLGDGKKEEIISEISANRDVIEEACQYRANHFCYPSGEYRKDYFSSLSACNVMSATTCKRGLNYDKTNIMELSRFLDGGNISDIEFEAELSGFSDVLRRIRMKLFGTKSAQSVIALSSECDMPQIF